MRLSYYMMPKVCESERSRLLKSSIQLRRSLILAALAVTAALFSVTAATYAWYIYNTAVRTTRVEMAAGSSVSLEISNSPQGPFGSSTVMEAFSGVLVPVSTDRITGGFQQVDEFDEVWNEATGAYRSVAKIFSPGTEMTHYYKTSLYLRTSGGTLDIYLSKIGYEDQDPDNPISTAMRVGLVAQEQEFIFAINTDPNPNADDNAAKEPEGGYVLQHDRTDGTTVPFTPYTSANFCIYDTQTGNVSLPEGAVSICSVSGDDNGGYGTPVKVDIYLWLEGCDKDCTMNLAGQTMTNLALSFAGFPGEGT